MSSGPTSDRPSALETLRSAARAPAEYARSWKQRTGRPVLGTFCSYVPEEAVIAAGALPFRILDVPGEFGAADPRLQAYACCLARGALALGSSGGLAFLDGVIFSNTCDTMQCLSDIWSANVCGGSPGDVETFMMPIHVGHAAARDYLLAEIERLVASLGARVGTSVEPAALGRAVADCRTARVALARLLEVQQGPSPVLTPPQYYDTTMARCVLPPDEYTSSTTVVLDDPQPLDRVGPRIVIAGGPMYAPVLPDLLAELGACWVADDLCTGHRAAAPGPAPGDDPVAAIADGLLSRPQCPAKHRTGHDPGRAVVERARQAAADGVILYRLKFCDPHAFDYPRIKEALDAAGLPSLLIEVETPAGSVGQLRTRLQAFLEMLADAGVSEVCT